jgi:hypothetical protein
VHIVFYYYSPQIAVEIYKKKFPPSSFEFASRMCSEVHTGGELQAVVNLLASTMMSAKNESRLQTLKIAIKDSLEVSVLPLVYLFTMGDCTTGVMNAYPRSVFQVRDLHSPLAVKGFLKYGDHEVGASETGVVLKRHTEKLVMSSCDALTIKDPRLLVLQTNTQDNFNTSTHFDYMGDAFRLQQQQQQQQSSSPKWLKAFCVDMLGDIYRSMQYAVVQRTRHTPISVLGGLHNRNPVIQNALFASSVKGEDSPILGYLSTIRNCVEAMETVASDIVSAHILSQDLIPLPFNFNRYILPSLCNAQSLNEAKCTLSSYRKEDSEALLMNCNVSSLLSAQTKKKVRYYQYRSCCIRSKHEYNSICLSSHFSDVRLCHEMQTCFSVIQVRRSLQTHGKPSSQHSEHERIRRAKIFATKNRRE